MEPGLEISHYRVVSRLGKGGMGEVFLAQDSNLSRPVALKILSPRFAEDPSRVRRFTNEAKTIATLSHPNIAHVYDLGEWDGALFIAMEYVEGQTLASRMASGACSIKEILAIGIQIADALAEAHEKGVVHRDVKPANVMLTERGFVKVLDFGLAKVLREEDESEFTNAATIDATDPGTIVGTIQYMSPEQALGHAVDHRSDIFSLGSVLYEMATGSRAFPGNTPAAVYSALLHDPPPAPSSVRAEIPPELDRILARALEHDPNLRYQTAADLTADLRRLRRDLNAGPPTEAFKRSEVAPLKRSNRRWALIASIFVVLVVAASWWATARKPSRPPLQAVPLTALPGVESQPSFSPDGNQVAFFWNSETEKNWDIYVKVLDSATQLRLTDNTATDFSPAWSPDGKQIAFLRQGDYAAAFYVISPIGGLERKLTDVHPDRASLDAPFEAWSPDGAELVITDRESSGEPMSLYVFSPATGAKRRLTTPPPKSTGDSSPCFSPDGKQVMFVRTTSLAVQDLYVVPFAGGVPKRLTSDNRRIFGSVWDPADGRIILSSGRGGPTRLWRFAPPEGKFEQIQNVGEGASYLAISRKGNHLAYTRSYIDTNVWRYPLSKPSAVPKRLISSTRHEQRPVYSPQGDRIAFASNRSGSWEIWVADREGQNAFKLTSQDGPATGSPAWSPDGKLIAFDSRPQGNPDIFIAGADGGTPRRLTTEPSQEIVPSWSHDGKWVYFVSDRSGSYQLWKMPASGGDAVQLTRQGGFHGIESPDGKYVYYAKATGGPGLWRVPVDGGLEEEVLGSLRAGYWGYWAIDSRGIYFVDREEFPDGMRYFLKSMHLPDRKISTITQLEKRPFNSGIALSPDSNWFLYTQVDQSDTDIMLVEKFH